MAYNVGPEPAGTIPQLPVGTFDYPVTARVPMTDVVGAMNAGLARLARDRHGPAICCPGIPDVPIYAAEELR
jgi:hypothetical protein